MKHKKKRNVGITYRLITSEITKNLINENTQLASRFLKIIKKRFRPGTQLNKELSLYNSLLSEGLRSDAVALRLIDDVIAESAKINQSLLNEEIDALNKDLHFLKPGIFDDHVNDYKEYASAYHIIKHSHKLSESTTIAEFAQCKDVILNRLRREQREESDIQLEHNIQTSRLIMSKMMSKLNEKYGDKLNGVQKRLLREYAFSITRDSNSKLYEALQSVRGDLLTSIDSFINESGNLIGEEVVSELKTLKETVVSENLNVVDDTTITRFLSYIDLIEECKR